MIAFPLKPNLFFRIASSVQKNIKDIVAKDGDIDCVNDRLNAFTATSTGQKILGMAQKIMQEIKLPYSEQVFLQESGFYPDKGTDHKGGKKESPTVASLLEMYATLEKPVKILIYINLSQRTKMNHLNIADCPDRRIG